MKTILILTGISSLFLSSTALHASETNSHIPGAKISLKIAKLQNKVEEYHTQIGRIKDLIKEHSLENENQLYTFLLSEKETSKNKENERLESDIELCKLGECYFLLAISQDKKRMKELQELHDEKYLNKKNECSSEEEINDLKLIKKKYTASDTSDFF